MIWKTGYSLVSVCVCHISSSDDAVIIVPVHCDLLQNTPLLSLNTVVVPGDRKGPGHQHNYNYHVRERERCAESGHQAGYHLSRENSVSQRRIYTPALNIRWGGGEAQTVSQAHHSEGCWPVISLVMSHHTSHLTPPATISIFPLTYWRLNRWTLGLQY